MAAIQLNFTLRTSANCKTVHLLGSWDSYSGQLPLSKDATKSGGWKGTFRFQGAALKQGQRYWYYYIIDGYHVSHDPARESVTEPTTGRKLNVLDIPHANKGAEPGGGSHSTSKAARQQRRVSTASVAKGRSLSPSQIQSPKPMHPNSARQITSEQCKNPTVETLSARFAAQQLVDSSDEEAEATSEEEDDVVAADSDSDVSSNVPSLTSRSSNSSTPSSISSTSSSCCTCERYGITRSGTRVKLDCGGSRCGYSEGSECSSESDDDHRAGTTRRQGVVVRK